MMLAVTRRGAAASPPWGALFLGAGVMGVVAVGLLRLDHIPFSVCFFKALSGLPCPTCGTTRALGRLFSLDVAGAFAMNPLAALSAIGVALWGLAELALLPVKRTLSFEPTPGAARALRIAAVAAILANWVFLLAAGR
jgi:hypothetical protein